MSTRRPVEAVLASLAGPFSGVSTSLLLNALDRLVLNRYGASIKEAPVREYYVNGKLYLDFGKRDGKRIRISAERYFEQIKRDGLIGSQVEHPLRFEDAATKYLRRHTYGRENRNGVPVSQSQAETDERVLRYLGRFFAKRMMHTITEAELRTYLSERGERVCPNTKRAPTVATMNREIAVITSFFRFMEREGHCTKSPARNIRQAKEHNMRTQMVATQRELELWRGQLPKVPPDVRDIWDLALHTGMRIGEVVQLKRDDYDPVHKTLRVENPKEKRLAEIPANRHVQAIVERRKDRGWLFLSRRGTPYTVGGIRSIFFRARDRAGIRKLWVHDLRRTFATRLRERGVELRCVQELLRHKDPKTTMRYTNVSSAEKRAAVDAIADLGLAHGRHSESDASVTMPKKTA